MCDPTKLCDTRKLSRKFITEIIGIYKSHPSLWKVKSKEYTNRNLKAKAYDILIEKFRELDEGSNRETVVKKINSLRSCYRKERKRLEASILSGATGDDVYKPTLWYFDQLTFLRNQEPASSEFIWTVDAAAEYLDNNTQETVESDIISEPSTPQDEELEDNKTFFKSKSTFLNSSQINFQRANSQKRKIAECEEIDLPVEHFSQHYDEDKFDLAGKTWAATLRSVPRDQQIYAEKIINDVMFEAQLGNLSRDSQLVFYKDPKE